MTCSSEGSWRLCCSPLAVDMACSPEPPSTAAEPDMDTPGTLKHQPMFKHCRWVPKACRQAAWILPLICAHTPRPLYLLLPVVKSFPSKGCDPSSGFFAAPLLQIPKGFMEDARWKKGWRKSSQCRQALVNGVGLAVLENKTLLAFAAQVSPRGEPGVPVPALTALKPVPESDQQKRGTATPHSKGSGEFLLPKGHSWHSVPLWSTHWHWAVTSRYRAGSLLQDIFCLVLWKLEVRLQQALQSYRIWTVFWPMYQMTFCSSEDNFCRLAVLFTSVGSTVWLKKNTKTRSLSVAGPTLLLHGSSFHILLHIFFWNPLIP